MPEQSDGDEDHTECAVCGYEPDPDRIPPHYVLSLDQEDISRETVESYPFGGSLSVPFACSDECWLDAQQDPELVTDGGRDQSGDGLEREANAITSAFNEAAADYSPDLTWYGMGVNHDSGQRQFVMEAERYVDPDGLEAVREAGWKIQYIEAHNHEFDDDVVISINFPVREVADVE
ncbi:hypothetical protein [Halorubrum tropicale]|uniref:Uncharacterized protein n=1 Tax=Halorubrum tropicale TaxID=1765655 RepID=A0A0M9AJH5_9EURY|nr:hypothetical protein [Halorubrum tropicale]KOX93252.1 hypothetical protein AMR74_16550 [Halorubrum tropicale]